MMHEDLSSEKGVKNWLAAPGLISMTARWDFDFAGQAGQCAPLIV
jgi:hypothetical protein